MTPRLLGLLVLTSLSFVASSAVAGPRASDPAPAKRVYAGKPTPQRGKLETSVTTLPSLEERKSAAAELVGGSVALPLVWAAPSVRKPFILDRASLVFASPQVVDPKRGIASWTNATSFSLGSLPDLCALFGCPGESDDTPPANGLQLWVKASAGKKYLAVCRVRLEGKKGDVVIESDGGFEITNHVDHTSKSFGKVSWLIDPSGAGWFGFSVSASTSWSTSGCTLDEI